MSSAHTFKKPGESAQSKKHRAPGQGERTGGGIAGAGGKSVMGVNNPRGLNAKSHGSKKANLSPQGKISDVVGKGGK